MKGKPEDETKTKKEKEKAIGSNEAQVCLYLISETTNP
jgi:hypothetical protein